MTSEIFLWQEGIVYDSVLEEFSEIINGQYSEAVLLKGIGSWKTYEVCALLLYKAYVLLCMQNPQEYYGLASERPIVCVNMGLTAEQAKKVVFKSLRNFVLQSRWFMGQNPVVLETTIKFGNKVELFSGNSKDTSLLGHNVFAAVLDEASFYHSDDKNDVDTAEEIYEQMSKRIVSRFGKHGFVGVISSPNHEDDFTVRKFRESRDSKSVYTATMPTWKAKDRRKQGALVFVFDHNEKRIVQPSEFMGYKHGDITLTAENIEKLEFGDSRDEYLWIIPEEYYDKFDSRPELASRDLGCKAGLSIDRFITSDDMIDKAMSMGVRNRFDGEDFDLSNPPTEGIYIHIDIGMNRGGKGDCAWFSACRCVGYNKEKDFMPIVHFDICAKIKAKNNGEIQIGDLRDIVFDMVDAWWFIEKVTLDNYQSYDTIQILNGRGIQADIQSVDTSLGPYTSLKDGIYSGIVMMPDYEPLKKELKKLLLIRWKKVDHPPKGSKDCSDSVAGAYHSCIISQWLGYIEANGNNTIHFRKK